MDQSKKTNTRTHPGGDTGARSQPFDIEKIIVITRQTRLEESIRRFNTISQAKYFVESRGQSFDDYVQEYDNYQRARDALVRSIPSEVRFQVIDRTMLPNFLFGPHDLAVPLGQDGLVVNTAKYLEGQSVLAFNPDPERFDGVLLPFLWHSAVSVIRQTLDGKLKDRSISMARADLNDGQHLYAFNDFFVGADSHVSARYTLRFGDASERHSSSGVIVSTPAGSTGWLSSLYNMAAGIQAFAGHTGSGIAMKMPASKNSGSKKASSNTNPSSAGAVKKKLPPDNRASPAKEMSSFKSKANRSAMNWDDRKLIFMVREPFRSNWSGADIVAGEIHDSQELVLESHMPEGGVIFSDGMLEDFMEFNSGATVQIRLAEKSTKLLVP